MGRDQAEAAQGASNSGEDSGKGLSLPFHLVGSVLEKEAGFPSKEYSRALVFHF